ncbi:histidine kinase [uncultured Draconibacterium sp.]|uniref:sensor histidine kinase n=1 Tax=uncultured Draconibacterium sp. TaxID=1573823 RepID=UPI0032609A07
MAAQLQHTIQKTRQSKLVRVAYHLIFWAIVGFFYFFVFYWNSAFPLVSVIFTIGLLPVAVVTTYTFNALLIPKYLNNKRYGYFIYLSIFTLLVSTWLSFLIVFYALIHLLNTTASLEPAVLHPELQVLSLNFIVFFAIAVKQVKRAFFIQQEKNELQQKKLHTELKLKEAELKLLKAQIHPHFLFNTLNNLYGLTMEKSDEAPELVLRLSEILDYILYRCNERRVLLNDEIANLRNHIEIEKIRYAEDKLTISADIPEETNKLQIAPLLLLPFVENAFKHGVSHNTGSAFVHINLLVKHTALHFAIANAKNETSQPNQTYSKGIGLQNVKKRLDLLYPNRYDLKINDSATTFSVTLTLQLET